LVGTPNYFLVDSWENGYVTINYDTTVIGNGYLEILPIPCGKDDDQWFSPARDTTHKKSIVNNVYNVTSTTNSQSITDTTNAMDSHNPMTIKFAQINIFPNPTQNNIIITYPCNTTGQLQICIKDVDGRERYTESVVCEEGGNVQYSIDLSSFLPGVYYISLTLNDQHVVKKIVKL
jgi:hypothetical protein